MKLRVILFEDHGEVRQTQEFSITDEQWRWANVGVGDQTLKRAMLAVLHDVEYEKDSRYRRVLRTTAHHLRELHTALLAIQEFVHPANGTPLEKLTLHRVHGLVNVLNGMRLEHVTALLNELAMLNGLELPNDPAHVVHPILGDWFYDLYRIRKPSDRSG